MNRLSLSHLILMLSLIAAGCSSKGDRPDLGQVSGVVKLDGQPIGGVLVSFQPTQGRGSDGVTDQDGRYQLNYLRGVPGAKLGAHRVAISSNADESDAASPVTIPKRYNSDTTLTAEVAAGANKVDFDLKSK